TSDRNAKEDIGTLDDTVGFINALQPVSYRFKGNSREAKAMGLIAQDVLEVSKRYGIPEGLVRETDGRYTLDYSQLIAPLIRSQQQMYFMMLTLEERINQLEQGRG
ncbi:hypothetical protein HK104_007937, partial [Borealophlyctis nickersoniae]